MNFYPQEVPGYLWRSPDATLWTVWSDLGHLLPHAVSVPGGPGLSRAVLFLLRTYTSNIHFP